MASALVGEHDFTSFCASDSGAKTRIRRILDIRTVDKSQDLCEVWILGEGFLKQMVRAIVGTLVQGALGKIEPSEMAAILAARDRKQAGKTAPAHGLCLVRIFYEPVNDLSSFLSQYQ